MILLEECFYSDRVGAIMKHRMVYSKCTPDGEVSREDFRPCFETNRFVIITIDDKDVGLFYFLPFTLVACEFHVRTLPCMWGKPELQDECMDLFRKWLIDNTSYIKMMSYVPEMTSPHVLNTAQRQGFKFEGRIDQSIMCRGILDNLIVIGKLIGRPKPNEVS